MAAHCSMDYYTPDSHCVVLEYPDELGEQVPNDRILALRRNWGLRTVEDVSG